MRKLLDVCYFSHDRAQITHVSIEDKLLQQYSTNVRKLSMILRDWVELSTDWDISIAKLRTADWLLRNDPSPLSQVHPTILGLSEGLSLMHGLHKNLSHDIQQICAQIIASGESIIASKSSSLTLTVQRILVDSENSEGRNVLVVRQERIRQLSEIWLQTLGLQSWDCLTAQQVIHSDEKLSRLVVVGLTKDYPLNLFNSVYPEYRTVNVSYSWIGEEKTVPGYFADIAQVSAELVINSVQDAGLNRLAREVSLDFLEPSAAIEGRRLAFAAKQALAVLEQSADEELVQCKAYLLASGEVVFLPTARGSIDTVDPDAPLGERVQRIPIASLTTESIVLLRVGNSDGETISNMANAIGGAEALRCRALQVFWKARLKERIKTFGTARVIRDLQDLGVANPWISEWARVGTIRPNSVTNFTVLLNYLNVSPQETVVAMGNLRHLHQVAGMRFRSMLKRKFETLDLGTLVLNGSIVIELEDETHVAKLGAFRCKSIGAQVFEVPESAVKQLQPGINA